VYMFEFVCMIRESDTQHIVLYANIKMFAFELAGEISRRGGNPVQLRLRSA
jgi:hypothetical protein